MKAAQIKVFGHADVVEIVDIPKPEVKEGMVLVEVHAASLNPFDTMVREGVIESMAAQLPFTLGGDIAGVIAEVGAGVTTVAVGDKVFGSANEAAGDSGAFAEFACTKADQVGAVPNNVDFLEAASLPLVGASAIQALTEHLKLQKSQKLFIHGGAGGIGAIAIQIAKHIGAQVTVTATGDAIAFAKDLGADEVIDYKTHDFSAVLHDFDAVFDTVGGDDFAKSLDILKPGGVAVSMTAHVDDAVAAQKGVTALTQMTHVTVAHLGTLRQFVEEGIVTPNVGQVFALEEVQQAFAAREGGQVKGKIVLKIKE